VSTDTLKVVWDHIEAILGKSFSHRSVCCMG
jgi:hypothetical protein